MTENNELNDIILNKGSATNNNKKIILAVATLGVILIVVVMLMNSLTSNGTDNLPQTPLPPQPNAQVMQEVQDEPLFEEVEVLEEDVQNNANLDEIAARLKEESQEEAQVQVQEKVVSAPVIKKPKPVAKTVQPKVTPTVVSPTQSTSSIKYYIQVGSFSKYAPNKKFLKSITDLGYKYKFHKILRDSKALNKVLVGPFTTAEDAKNARRILRAKIEPGAFLVKL